MWLFWLGVIAYAAMPTVVVVMLVEAVVVCTFVSVYWSASEGSLVRFRLRKAQSNGGELPM